MLTSARTRRMDRESLATAMHQSEGPTGFDWDIALDLGDMSGAQGTPKDAEGQEIVRQFGALNNTDAKTDLRSLRQSRPSGLDEPQAWWWRKWVDPTGEHTEFSRVDASKRRFPIEGTWERYSFRVGNLLFLMMSDINEPTQKTGRGHTRGKSRRRGERRDVPLVEANGRGESVLHHHQRASLRAQEHDRRVRRMGRHG